MDTKKGQLDPLDVLRVLLRKKKPEVEVGI